MTSLFLLVAVLFSIALQKVDAPQSGPAAQDSDWKQIVLDKAGIEVWPSVTRIKFTFNVERNGEVTSRSHNWDLRTGVDSITSGDDDSFIATVNVWKYDVETANNAEKGAFSAWTNDSYWLLMPLKLGDPGVNFGNATMTRDMPPSRANVTMSFGDGVGITSNDQYDLSINLREGVVDSWTYRPNADTAITWTWQDYKDFNGLYLATNHVAEGGGPRIYFTDVEVTTRPTNAP